MCIGIRKKMVDANPFVQAALFFHVFNFEH